jgi:hypothetical protein
LKPSPLYLHLLLFLLSFSFCACSQDSTKQPSPYKQQHKVLLGSTAVLVTETAYKSDVPIQLIQLHSNERTAGDVARLIAEEKGISYLQLSNNSNRLLHFTIKRQTFTVDPNRIFSTEGIVASLQLHSSYNADAFAAVVMLRDLLLSLVDRNKTLVALHNNTDGNFSLADYRKKAMGLVHQNTAHDNDNFFITTDSTLFERLKEKNFNVVLEYSNRLKDDGSLSIYCKRNGIRYVNVEAEHGRQKEQELMVRTLIDILK